MKDLRELSSASAADSNIWLPLIKYGSRAELSNHGTWHIKGIVYQNKIEYNIPECPS